MKIEVTGCNNCPFYYKSREHGRFCNAYNDLRFEEPKIKNDEVVPHNCPITLNGGTITVTTKSE